MSKLMPIRENYISSLIYYIRGEKVMLDYDLATLYAVETRALKQAVRRNIDEMDPRKINGMFDDDGYEIRRDTIKMQPLCLTCIKNNSDDWEDDILCNLNRSDQTNGKEFRCGAYEKY